MGEDMTSHQALLEEMRQEWGCLKKNDLPSLLPLLQVKEAHMRRIKGHRESMAQIINGLLGEGVGKDRPRVLSDLFPLVSPSQAQRIKSYRRGIERLLHQVVSLNEQNKRFIQETLDYIKSIFSLFTSSQQEEMTYAQGGKTVSTSLPPRWMSRKV
jgi:flagellar biosynthesis/type III secretory pathway chaperone